MTDQLKQRRVLVVEDSPLIAEATGDMLRDLGCVVVGPTGSLAVAMDLAASEKLDAAVIDVNIRGWKVFPVADALASRGVPFLFASGYADWSLPEHLEDRPRLEKPYNATTLERKLLEILSGSTETGEDLN